MVQYKSTKVSLFFIKGHFFCEKFDPMDRTCYSRADIGKVGNGYVLEIVTKVASIILLDIVLSGDNAVTIALATKRLDEKSRKKAIFIGTAGAIVLRVLLMLIAIQILAIPYVKIIGSLLLFYIAYDLLVANEEPDDSSKATTSFMSAIGTIMVADLIMSLDNILSIAGVASDNQWLALLGLAISIPLIIFGSQLVLGLMDRFPILVWIGALLIAYTAGKMFIEDHLTADFVNHIVPNISHTIVIPLMFCVVLFLFYQLFSRKKVQSYK